MGHLGKLTTLADLPSDQLILNSIKEAMRLNDEGIKLPERKKMDHKTEVIIPDSLKKELSLNKIAYTTFNDLSPSHKREYTTWIMESKTEGTHNKRIATTIKWLSEGKSMNWKYSKK